MFRSIIFNRNRKQTLQFGIYVLFSPKNSVFPEKLKRDRKGLMIMFSKTTSQLSFTRSRPTVETLEKRVRYVQS